MKIKLMIASLLIMFTIYGQTNSKANPKFVTTSLLFTDSSTLHWESTYEGQQLPYSIQQYLWGKWEPIGEVMGKGGDSLNKYDYPIVLCSGLNHLRIVQYDYNNNPRVSPAVKVQGPEPASQFTLSEGKISLTRKTHYRLYFGTILFRSGIGDSIDIKDLPKGLYKLKFDNQTAEITL